jgi:hypothetical protein
VRFYKGAVKNKASYHLSLGHFTVMGTATFFGSNEHATYSAGLEYQAVEELQKEQQLAAAGSGTAEVAAGEEGQAVYKYQYAVLELDVRFFFSDRKVTLEDAIGSHACSLEANMRVTNGIPLGSSPSYQLTL